VKRSGKQTFILTLCGTSVALAHAGEKPKTGKSNKTNIIYILADDLGYGDLSCYGQTKFATPNLDALAAQGLRFTNHYAGCTVSAPSRCSLMTGLHTGHAPVRGNNSVRIDDEVYNTALPDKYKTVAECLKEQDYTTACIGKWGLGGPGTEGHPNNQGFDYFYGHLGQGHAHFYYPQFMFENDKKITLNIDPKEKKYYAEDLFMEKATRFITENKDQPFFLYLAVTIPHAELIVPDDELDKFKGMYDEPTPWPSGQHYAGEFGGQPYPRAAFAAMITRLDGDVGRIRQLLEELGIDRNTLLIFTSDNGPHKEGGADPEFFNSGGGLRGIKRDLYEGGIRVPMIAYWPEVIQSGRTIDTPSAFWDVLPTFCEMTGAEIPESLDGISFLPELNGEKRKVSHDYFYWEFHENSSQAVRKGNWKAVRKNIKSDPTVELYDLSVDRGETNDIAVSHPDIVAELEELMKISHTNDTQWKFPEN
jgi:arylsulfatase A-like enzyme